MIQNFIYIDYTIYSRQIRLRLKTMTAQMMLRDLLLQLDGCVIYYSFGDSK